MRWPTKPPANAKCDASLGWRNDALGCPVIVRCKELATETVKLKSGIPDFSMYLCTPHAELFEEQDKIERNPKRKKK